jgi:NTE family protein
MENLMRISKNPGARFLTMITFSLLIFFTKSWAQLSPDSLTQAPFKVGLALSGGGARGIAHIGAIIALEEQGIPIDMVAGTSMGSIVGGLYAAGYSGNEMRQLVKQIDWQAIFEQKPDPAAEFVSERFGILKPLIRFRFKFWELYLPYGLNNGQRISDELFQFTAAANFAAQSNFDSLAVPYRALAVDAATGEVLALNQGDLAQAIHASMAIPFVFAPARVENRLLVDGGVLNILPTDAVKNMGADVVLAVDLEQLFPLGEEPKHISEVAIHTLDITIRELKKENVALADVLIEPDLGDHSAYNYSNFDFLIEQGYQATMAKMADIKKLVPLPVAVENRRGKSLNKILLEQAQIKKITIDGREKVRPPVILREFPLKTGDTFNLKAALDGVKNIYASGLFENVWLELDNLGDHQVGVNIHVIEKYPRSIGFSVNYQQDVGWGGFIQIIHYNFLGWGERFMPILQFGETYQKFGLDIVNDRFFATPLAFNNGLYYEQIRPYIYETGGKKTGQLNVDRVVAKFSVGVQPIKRMMLLTGIRGERVWTDRNEYLSISAATQGRWLVFGQAIFDNMDDPSFPRKGVMLSVEAESSMGDETFEAYTKMSARLKWIFPMPWRQAFGTSIFIGTSANGLPVYEKFRLGGPLDLPGYHLEELWGDHAAALRFHHQVKVFKRWYWQSSLFFVNVNDNDLKFDSFTRGISTGLLADSPLGPVSINYGWSEEDRKQAYVSMGYEF